MNPADPYTLVATISSAMLYHADAGRDSYYQGHLTHLIERDLWVAWVEYDRFDMPGKMRATVTKSPAALDVALNMLNERLEAKLEGAKGRVYHPITSAEDEDGLMRLELIHKRRAFIEQMNALL